MRRQESGDFDVALPYVAGQPTEGPLAGAELVGASSPPREHGDLTLEVLMRQALEVPGAAAALLDAFAAQSRALRLVQEAHARGAATLPTELRQGLEAAAARTPTWLSAGSGSGVRA